MNELLEDVNLDDDKMSLSENITNNENTNYYYVNNIKQSTIKIKKLKLYN